MLASESQFAANIFLALRFAFAVINLSELRQSCLNSPLNISELLEGVRVFTVQVKLTVLSSCVTPVSSAFDQAAVARCKRVLARWSC